MAETSAEAFLALGGNVGDVRASFDRAIALLCDGQAVCLVARSSNYRTAPWGVTDQPSFINAVIEVTTMLPAHDLLASALSVERALGRDRGKERRWGQRTLDVDILVYDGLIVDGPELTLPHPHLLERAFVLAPLAEIAPDCIVAGTRVCDALKRIDASGVEKLPPR